MAYYLAVDAGGTKAEFLLSDGERELARAMTGTIKRVNTDAADAAKNLEAALADLERQTGVSPAHITCTCIGTSGNTVPLVTDWLKENFAQRVDGSLIVMGDVEIALDSVFQGERGVLVLAGTGSNVAARDGHGKISTAGGWGPILGDQCAGHWIGVEGLRRGFLALDEQRPTELLERARRLWNLPSIAALIEFANAGMPQRYGSQMAPEVVACAEDGDAIAIEILEQGGRDLAYLAGLLIERMRDAEEAAFTVPKIAIAGSIMAKVTRARQAMQHALRERYPQIEFIDAPADPVRGALWRAMRGA